MKYFSAQKFAKNTATQKNFSGKEKNDSDNKTFPGKKKIVPKTEFFVLVFLANFCAEKYFTDNNQTQYVSFNSTSRHIFLIQRFQRFSPKKCKK